MQPENRSFPPRPSTPTTGTVTATSVARDFLEGVKRFVVVGLAAGATADALMSNNAADAAGLEDRRSDQSELRDGSVSAGNGQFLARSDG